MPSSDYSQAALFNNWDPPLHMDDRRTFSSASFSEGGHTAVAIQGRDASYILKGAPCVGYSVCSAAKRLLIAGSRLFGFYKAKIDLLFQAKVTMYK